MSGPLAHVCTALLLRCVPSHLRENIQGDLLETGGGPREALALAAHFQAEPYREASDRRAVLRLLLAGAGLQWLVPEAAAMLLADAAVFGDGLARTALAVWRRPELVAAVAAGLLVGRASVLPRHANAARSHAVLLLAAAGVPMAPEPATGLLAALTIIAAAALGDAHRRASATDPATPRSP